MNRESRQKRMAKDKLRAAMFASVMVLGFFGLMGVLWTQKGEGLDHQGCPKSGPGREVVVLLDTSDPLSEKHKAELSRIVREMTSPVRKRAS